jgi:hypothetical protein
MKRNSFSPSVSNLTLSLSKTPHSRAGFGVADGASLRALHLARSRLHSRPAPDFILLKRGRSFRRGRAVARGKGGPERNLFSHAIFQKPPARSDLICFYDLPHPDPLPQRRGNIRPRLILLDTRSPIADARQSKKPANDSPSPEGEGRDEGEPKTIFISQETDTAKLRLAAPH